MNGHKPVKLAFSRDDSQLVGALTNRTVRIWDAATGSAIRTLTGHSDLVLDVAFSPDGKRLATASYDRTVRLWDLDNGRAQVLRGHWASVDQVAWTSDGARVITGSRDGTVRIWTAPPVALPDGSDVRRQLDDATTAVIGADDRPATP